MYNGGNEGKLKKEFLLAQEAQLYQNLFDRNQINGVPAYFHNTSTYRISIQNVHLWWR